MRMSRLTHQGGFTIPAVVGAIVLVSLLVAAMAAAVNGDLGLTRRDLHEKQAYEAALAGMNDYSYHLSSDNSYWSKCTNVPEPNAVNQLGSTSKRRPVPGNTGAEYALELVPAEGSGYGTCDINNPASSMLQSAGTAQGTFRIRSTGFSGPAEQSIVATYKRQGFVDFLYFTQLETSDPTTYGFTSQTAIQGAANQCSKYARDGRYSNSIPGTGGLDCNAIYFIDGEQIAGPLHTNDQICVDGSPTFGRDASDQIEVGAPPQGWNTIYCTGSASPNFQGTYETNAAILTPPPSNGQLEDEAPPEYTFTGAVRITLDGSDLTVVDNTNTSHDLAFPTNGVIYVKNGTCSSNYTPYNASWSNSSGCGNVRIRGDYSGRLTVAAENDIVVDEDVVRSGDGMLGLIANNFVRVWHGYPTQSSRTNCGSGSGESRVPNVRIDAAILAIQHSFIVDHFNCGAPLGTLTVNGAIAQKYRGPVGTFGGGGGTGYSKDYNYDDRLRYTTPPHFLDPVETAWAIQRETLDG